MKILGKLIAVLILSILVSNFLNYTPKASTANVIYTVSGILFSIGLGLVITFTPHGLKNASYIQYIRKNINQIKIKFFTEFTIATICFILFSLDEGRDVINFYELKINLQMFFMLQILSSIPYLVTNFLSIQKLNNDLFDRLNSEDENK